MLGPIDFFGPQALMKGIEVHTPNLPGYGSQPLPPGGVELTLEQQAAWIVAYLRSHIGRPAWLLGHSVGGAVAMLAARMAPDLVTAIISVEGNFTLGDAFWCQRIAPMREDEWAAEHARMQSEQQAWLAKSGIEPTARRLEWAQTILHNQAAATVHAMAKAVVRETAVPGYLAAVRDVIHHGTQLHLLAGERSCTGWDLPPWVRTAAASTVVLPGVGHMMMLEAPEQFCKAVASMMLPDGFSLS
ncbi:alpha/beta hydrolase [Aquincola sp. MAHUQ-54]|uniref:Alpha/beta hydrolase n=1 Tax=Aquincola agrisoli TaxID=3119538 RepID=A0AAW9QEV5_9BURK